MSPRWIRLLGAAVVCLLLLGCGDDGPEPGSDEISDLAVSESELIHIIDVSGDTTKGTQSVTFENHRASSSGPLRITTAAAVVSASLNRSLLTCPSPSSHLNRLGITTRSPRYSPISRRGLSSPCRSF